MRTLRTYAILIVFALVILIGTGQAGAATLSTKGPVEADCDTILKAKANGRLMVALVFGQSNSANFGLTQKASIPGVYSFNKGRCFRAADPLPGAEGNGGSIWTRLGDRLISSGLYDNVLFVPVGAGATRVADWKPGGRVHHRLAAGLRGALATGFTFTHLLWMQGEHDAIAKTTRKLYVEDFEEMLAALRSGGVDAKLLVSLTSLCGIFECDAVSRAQRQLVKEHPGVFSGPDTDAVGKKYSYDACHFNDKGLEAAASAWLEAIKKAK